MRYIYLQFVVSKNYYIVKQQYSNQNVYIVEWAAPTNNTATTMIVNGWFELILDEVDIIDESDNFEDLFVHCL